MTAKRDEETVCPWHADHENRISKLEVNMDTLNQERVSAGRWAVVLGFLGVVFTAISGLVGTLLGFWAKAQGWL
jgi:hypothetical protein